MKNLLTILGGLAIPLVFATTVLAADPTIGNDVASRPYTDTYSNFVIIDTNNPADATGEIQTFRYYASALKPFRFLLVDGSWSVMWVGDEITPSELGVNTYEPSSPVHVESGWNVGLYFAQTGVIPFDMAGLPVWWRANDSGLPAVGNILTFEGNGTQNRTYSFVAKIEDEDHEDGDHDEDENEEDSDDDEDEQHESSQEHNEDSEHSEDDD